MPPTIKPFSFPRLTNSQPSLRFDRQVDSIGGAGGGGGGGDEFTPPLYLVQVDAENVKVSFGQVNGITPTDVNTNIDVSGSNSTWAIYIEAVINPDGTLDTVAILSNSAGTIPSDFYGTAYKLVGLVTVSGDVISSINTSLAWSQTFVACGRDPDDPTTTPGTYYWVVA